VEVKIKAVHVIHWCKKF